MVRAAQPLLEDEKGFLKVDSSRRHLKAAGTELGRRNNGRRGRCSSGKAEFDPAVSSRGHADVPGSDAEVCCLSLRPARRVSIRLNETRNLQSRNTIFGMVYVIRWYAR